MHVATSVVQGTSTRTWQPCFGAWRDGDAWSFRVWAPSALRLELVLRDGSSRPLVRGPDGIFTTSWPGLRSGDRYGYRVDGKGPFPDVASRSQPDGVHEASQLIDPDEYQWRDDGWQAPALADAVIYELHIGTFTPSGTFVEAARKLPTLAALGVNVIEVMPIAAFAGSRNWGYDGVALYAPAACYGTPDDFRDFVSAAHANGLAVVLDVVYNHVGPDGAYHGQYAQTFMKTGGEWGGIIDFQDPDGENVRSFCIDNALHWLHEYHLDGLRLDATHAFHDGGTRAFVRELCAAIRTHASRPVLLIAEDDRNDVGLLRQVEDGGAGLDAVWADDFHHQMRRLIAGDSDGYFESYAGTTAALADTIEHGWFFRGQCSSYHGKKRGTEPIGARLEQFIVCLQNHDQVGNRAMGDRLHHAIDLAAWRAASVVLLSMPETPLLFMGQEWAATSPFQYFTDHAGELGAAVTDGRRREFGGFPSFREHPERVPDPQAVDTFESSRLRWDELLREPHASVWRLYQRMLTIRREELKASGSPAVVHTQALDDDTLLIERVLDDGRVVLCVARLRGRGRVDFLPTFARGGASQLVWSIRCSPEDREYACHPHRLMWGVDGERHWTEFERPGALLMIGVRQ
jgi:maltooligosyltrehalose trehalohydrolase